MTPIRASIAGAIASIILILVVVELVRGRRLKERYALLWLATGRLKAKTSPASGSSIQFVPTPTR